MNNDPMFFPRLRQHARYTFIGMAVVVVAVFVIVVIAKAVT